MKGCKTCERAGLSVLLVRPSVIATDAAFAPIAAAGLQTHAPTVGAFALPGLGKSRYTLRLLRSGGFVYVYYTVKPPQLLDPWQVFRVAEGGVLVPESQVNWAASGAPEFTCSRNPLHPHDVRTLCVQLPEHEPTSAGPMWVGYSMNWWDKAFRAKVQGSPQQHGMSRIDPLASCGGVAHAFAATADDLERYVGDFALSSLQHGRQRDPVGTSRNDKGLGPANPLYDQAFGHAASMTKAMKQLADAHPATRGREFVLAIQDPVGLAADANAIRMARHVENQRLWSANEDWVRSDACHAVLEGLRKTIETGAVAESIEGATQASERQWRSVEHHKPNYTWTPIPNTWAQDGSRAGTLTPKHGYAPEFERRMRQQSIAIAKRRWERITGQIDQGRFAAWPGKKRSILADMRAELAAYEADWMQLGDGPALQAYFRHHFDEDDPGKLTARARSGEAYASESSLAHRPQPFTSVHLDAWVEQVLGREIVDPTAIALRAGFGNQRSVISKVHALLVGNWDRSPTPGRDGEPEMGDMRDKTVDLLKGVLTHDLGKRFNWLHPRVMALAAGGLASTAAGVFQLLAIAAGQSPSGPSVSVNRYRNRLLNLSVAQHQVMAAAESAGPGRASSLSVLVRTKVDLDGARLLLAGLAIPAAGGAAAAAGNAATRTARATIDVLALTDVKTVMQIKEGKQVRLADATVRMSDTHGASVSAPDRWMKWPQGVNALTVDEVADVVRRLETVKELKLNSVDGRLAIGSMTVQFLGLIQAVPALLEAINQRQRDWGRITQAGLESLDALSGFIGGALEKLASSERAALMLREGGLELAETSRKVAMLRAGAAVTGMIGGGITAVLMGRKEDEARAAGDQDSATFYMASAAASSLSVAISGAIAADALTSRAVSAAMGRHMLMRVAGLVATEAAATAMASSIIAGVGVVLLLGTIAAAAVAVALERDQYMRWAGRSYFGKDKENKFTSASAEFHGLNAIAFEPMAARELRRLLKSHPYKDETNIEPMPEAWMPFGA